MGGDIFQLYFNKLPNLLLSLFFSFRSIQDQIELKNMSLDQISASSLGGNHYSTLIADSHKYWVNLGVKTRLEL